MTSRNPAAQQNLVDLLAQVDKLQTVEDQLLLELAQVRTQKCSLLQLANAEVEIGRLPDEVLAEIFRHLDGGWDDDDQLPFLIRAAQVTKRWRYVTLSIPSLWSTIEFRPHSRYQRYWTKLIKEYLARSCASLLDIEIHMCENQDVTQVVDLLIPEIYRCVRLAVQSADELAIQTLFRALHDQHAPCLEHLRIDLEDVEQRVNLWLQDNCTLAHGLPSLKFLEIRGINMYNWLPPLGRVKSIYMGDCDSANLFSYSLFRKILIASTSLTHLELDGMINYSTHDDVTLIEMPSLVSLSVRPLDYGRNSALYIRNIFTTISAPSLQTLCLKQVHGPQFRVFLETFGSASCHPVLETLVLYDVNGLEHLTPKLALSSPTITHLSLKFTDPTPVLQLLMDHNVDPLWPLLQTLTVTQIDNALLRSFISGRISAGRPLVKLRHAPVSYAEFNNIPTSEMNWFVERLRVEYVSYCDM